MELDEKPEDLEKKIPPFNGDASGVSTCLSGSTHSAFHFTGASSFDFHGLRRRRSTRVPLISVTSLYNRLQTSGVVLIDCRRSVEFSAGHLPDALHCPNVHTRAYLLALGCAGPIAVDNVLELLGNVKLREKLKQRDLMEIIVIGGNHSSRALLYKMGWGYRFAKMLMQEGRVFSVRFLAQGFPAFAKKYRFMLVSSPQWTQAPNEADVSSSTSMMHFPNEIVDGFLYLGNFWQANSKEVINALQITHIVNVGAITEQRNTFEHVDYLDILIKDKVDVDITQEFGPILDFIQKAADERGRVLIHCVQGVSRSSTICIWYVMHKTKCSLSAAYSHVLKCRPLIFPNRGFMTQLIANERELYGSQSVMEDEVDMLQKGLLSPVDRSGSALNLTFLT